ncbi:hypothetical protein IWQ56_002539 [Coemansia nantahalensis]|nr:hypothetical protein IWQ56_002539 [Coemansia nantahalensis]
MVSFSAYAAAALAFAGAARAGFYTTYPVGADQISSLQQIQIKWQPNADAPSLVGVTKYTLRLMTGGNFVQTTVATIGTFDISQTTVPFTMPKTAPGMYFLMYSIDSATAGASWSTRFSVDKGTTWYPEGVATGRDPGSTETGATSGVPSSTPKSSNPGVPTSASGTESTALTASGVTSDSDDHQSTPDNTDTESTASSDDTQSSSDTTGDATSDATSDAASDTESHRSKPHKSSRSSDSSEEPSEESSEESSQEPETSSSGAATYFLSMAAILAASLAAI